MNAAAQDRTGPPVLAPETAGLARATAPEAPAYLAQAIAEFNAKQEALRKAWIGDYERWDIDMRRAVLVLSGRARTVTFDVTFVGSSRAADRSWEWGWYNPNVPKGLSGSTRDLPAVGRRLGFRDLESGQIALRDERLAWLFAAIALKESGALGVFRADGHGQFFYFLLANPRASGG